MKRAMTSAQEFVRRLDTLDAECPMDDAEILRTIDEFGLDRADLINEGRAVVERFDGARLRTKAEVAGHPQHPSEARTPNKGHAESIQPPQGTSMRSRRTAVFLGLAVLLALALTGWLTSESKSGIEPRSMQTSRASVAGKPLPAARFDPAEWQSPKLSAEELAAPGGTPPLQTQAKDSDGQLVVAVQVAGSPAAGAKVRLYLRGPRDPNSSGSQWRFAGGGVTDAEGRLKLAARPGDYLIAARANGYATARREVVRPVAEAVTEVLVALQQGNVLRGAAIEKASRAEVPLTELALTRFSNARSGRSDAPMEEMTSVRTDARGRFEVAGLEPGLYALEAVAPGHGTLRLQVLVPRTTELTLELGAASTLEGRVVDAKGAPAVGAEVVSLGDALTAVMTGPEGTFAMEVSPGRYTLSARLGKQTGALENAVVVELGGTRKGLLLRLGEGGRIEGIVQSKAGQAPVAAAVVALTPFGGEGDLGQTTTSSDGRFAIETLAAGVYDVEVYAEGYSPFVRRGVTLSAAQRFPLKLELDGTGSVTGIIRDGTGAPVADAIVRGGQVWGGPFIWGSSGQTRSGPDGRYRLTGLEAGRVRINAGRSSASMFAHDFVSVRPAEETQLDLKLEEPGSVSGKVTRSGGRVLDVEAIVRAVPQEFATREDIRTVPVERDGHYRLALPPGRYWIGAFGVDQFPAMGRNAATVISPSALVEKDLEVPDADAELLLSGNVVEPDGTPSPGAYVLARGAASGKGPAFMANVRADERGHFEVRKKSESSATVFDVSSRSGGRIGGVRGVRVGTTELTVPLTAPAIIAGRVEGGTRPATVRVLVQTLDDAAMPWLSSDPQEFDGDTFELHDVPATAVRVTAFAADGSSGNETVTASPGATTRVTVKLLSAASVKGRIVDEDGKPLRGVVTRVDGRGEVGPTGVDGAFEISDIVPGKHSFSAGISGFAPLQKELSLSPGVQLDLGDVPLVRAP